MEEEQTEEKEKVQKNRQRSAKHTHETNDRLTRTLEICQLYHRENKLSSNEIMMLMKRKLNNHQFYQ